MFYLSTKLLHYSFMIFFQMMQYDAENLELKICSNNHNLEELKLLINKAYIYGEGDIIPWTLDGKNRLTANSESLESYVLRNEIVIASYHKVIVGTLKLSPSSHVNNTEIGMVGQFAVDKKFRRFGIGKKLMDYGEKLAKTRGYVKLQIEILYPMNFEHKIKKFLRDWYRARLKFT